MKVPRRRARVAAFSAIFSALSETGGAVAMLNRRRQNAESGKEAAALADALTEKVAAVFDSQREEIDKLLTEALNRPPEHISVAERALISAATAELLSDPQTPPKIIINEAVEIAKQYGAEGGYKLVNAALDTITRAVRG